MSRAIQSKTGRLVQTDVVVSSSLVETKNNKLLKQKVEGLQVVVVDDDPNIRLACSEITKGMGCLTDTADTLAAAQMILNRKKVDILLLDLKLPDGSGLVLLDQIKASHPETSAVVMTAYATVSSAVEAMRIGARDYLTKPFGMEEMITIVERAGQRVYFDRESRLLREKLRSQGDESGLAGCSAEMEKIFRIVSKVAFSTHPVLILGESGTGKEVVARAIHFNGPNADKPFVPVDCSSLAPALIESELFGHVKGAFSGADRAKDGLLCTANGGTVFLDEIGELPLALQAKLLRALQDKEIRPVGGTHSKQISARVLAATSRDLVSMVEQGKFRKDLFFRLNVVSLKLPSLRERREDVPLLATYFLTQLERETGIAHKFSSEAMQALIDYDWPGNVRELESTIAQACALSNAEELYLGDLPSHIRSMPPPQPSFEESVSIQWQRHNGIDTSNIVPLEEIEKNAIVGTVRQLQGDKLLAAKLLGIGKTTLYRKLKEYDISFDAATA